MPSHYHPRTIISLRSVPYTPTIKPVPDNWMATPSYRPLPSAVSLESTLRSFSTAPSPSPSPSVTPPAKRSEAQPRPMAIDHLCPSLQSMADDVPAFADALRFALAGISLEDYDSDSDSDDDDDQVINDGIRFKAYMDRMRKPSNSVGVLRKIKTIERDMAAAMEDSIFGEAEIPTSGSSGEHTESVHESEDQAVVGKPDSPGKVIDNSINQVSTPDRSSVDIKASTSSDSHVKIVKGKRIATHEGTTKSVCHLYKNKAALRRAMKQESAFRF